MAPLPSANSIEAARNAGINVDTLLASNERPAANPFAKLLGRAGMMRKPTPTPRRPRSLRNQSPSCLPGLTLRPRRNQRPSSAVKDKVASAIAKLKLVHIATLLPAPPCNAPVPRPADSADCHRNRGDAEADHSRARLLGRPARRYGCRQSVRARSLIGAATRKSPMPTALVRSGRRAAPPTLTGRPRLPWVMPTNTTRMRHPAPPPVRQESPCCALRLCGARGRPGQNDHCSEARRQSGCVRDHDGERFLDDA